MEDVKFKTRIKRIGKLSEGLIKNNYLILFDERDDDFASEFGFTVEHVNLNDNINIGDIVVIDNSEYKILDISEKTNEGLKEETHVSFHIDRDFDGNRQILLEGNQFPEIFEGSEIKIKQGF